METPLYSDKFDRIQLKQTLIDIVREANAKGINQGTSGNASVRQGEEIFITPSRVPYHSMQPEDIVTLNSQGETLSAGRYKPSSEWRIHIDIFRARKEINAILHTHGCAVSTLACLHRDIPAFHYMISVAGGDSVRCAPYATFGTQALSDTALRALDGRKACLLANHGAISLGTSLTQAIGVAEELEHLADVYWRCLQVGEPRILSTLEMQEVLAQFAKGETNHNK